MEDYTNIKKEVIKAADKQENSTLFYVRHGYMPTWAPEHCGTDPDRGLEQYSTPYRWRQYKKGEITRDKAVEMAIKRVMRETGKRTAKQLQHLDDIATVADLTFISVSVEWTRSRTWGYNPHAEVRTNTGRYTGTASGCGYDKESAAVASALNECSGVLKILYDAEEKALETRTFEKMEAGKILGYGAGYGVIPRFEGGVGVSCFWNIFEKCGFKLVSEHHGKHSDFYELEKGVQ